MKLLLKNANCFIVNKLEARDVLIEGDKITRLSPTITDDTAHIIDCKQHLLAPGFIDLHIHLREPGGEQKETIQSGTKAEIGRASCREREESKEVAGAWEKKRRARDRER